MPRRNPLSLLLPAALVALVALAVAGCGGGGDQASAASANPNASGASTIGVGDAGGLGKILVDSQGRTAYLFEKDTGPRSTCSGDCAVEWPPVTASGKPTAGDGLSASMLGTTKRSDGTTQVTFNGHPLYRFEGDQQPGDTSGQGLDFFGAKWFVLSSAGDKVTGSGQDSGSKSSGGSGYPY